MLSINNFFYFFSDIYLYLPFYIFCDLYLMALGLDYGLLGESVSRPRFWMTDEKLKISFLIYNSRNIFLP
jgi:hypothetical protein